jgi:DNA polymerase III alpha subunit
MIAIIWITPMSGPMKSCFAFRREKPSRTRTGSVFRTDQLYFKSPAEMTAAFARYPDAVANTRVIADRCQITFEENVFHFPHFVVDGEKSEADLFTEQTWSGFEKDWSGSGKASGCG